jgi:hypothetical protein
MFWSREFVCTSRDVSDLSYVPHDLRTDTLCRKRGTAFWSCDGFCIWSLGFELRTSKRGGQDLGCLKESDKKRFSLPSPPNLSTKEQLSNPFDCGSKEPLGGEFAPRSASETQIPVVIFTLGGPGAGKGTNCTRLASEFGFLHVSAGYAFCIWKSQKNFFWDVY